jgi:hypothetical protein
MKVALYTYHNTNVHEGASFAEVGDLTLPSKRAYCECHGYDFFFGTDFDYTKVPLGFERVEMALDYLSSYDWMLYTDADAIITNPNIRVEDLVDENYDIMVSHDTRVSSHVELNNGVMFLRNTPWVHEILRWMHQPLYHSHRWLSQQALMDVVNRGDGQRIKLSHFRDFNSLWHSALPEFNWQPGDFILHACGGGNLWRKTLFTEIAPKVAAGSLTSISTPQAK